MNFQKKTLSNGMTVIHEKRDVPVVSLGITNRFGGSHEPAEIKGVAHLIEHLLFTGTETRTHEDISREIEKKGGIINAYTAEDITTYWFKLPSEHLMSGLKILVDMLKNPKFDPEKFEKEKKVVLEEIKMYHDMPQRHIYDRIQENLYEKPFGIGIIGTKETVSSLTRDSVKDLFTKKYSPENYIVTFVGEANFDEVCNYLEAEFPPSENKNGTTPLQIIKKNESSTEERSGLDQAHFMFGMHAPLSNDPKRYILEVLDAYLANGMSSRMFLEIREKRGLAYAVTSSINLEKSYSYYAIYVGTTKEAIPEVKKLIIQEFEKVSEMTEADLSESKERLIGLKKVTSEESSRVMNELIFEELFENSENYYDHEEKIKKVSLSEVKELAKELIKNYSTTAIVPK